MFNKEIKMTHILMIAIIALLLYSLVGGCRRICRNRKSRCINGFRVGGAEQLYIC